MLATRRGPEERGHKATVEQDELPGAPQAVCAGQLYRALASKLAVFNSRLAQVHGRARVSRSPTLNTVTTGLFVVFFYLRI